jgi:hypothetical protein
MWSITRINSRSPENSKPSRHKHSKQNTDLGFYSEKKINTRPMLICRTSKPLGNLKI